jgi:hypothetical protein
MYYIYIIYYFLSKNEKLTKIDFFINNNIIVLSILLFQKFNYKNKIHKLQLDNIKY